MTALVTQLITADTDRLEVVRQDYELAKRDVRQALMTSDFRDADRQRRFRAAMLRQEEARERYLRAMGA